MHECARAHRKTGTTAVKHLSFAHVWCFSTPQRHSLALLKPVDRASDDRTCNERRRRLRRASRNSDQNPPAGTTMRILTSHPTPLRLFQPPKRSPSPKVTVEPDVARAAICHGNERWRNAESPGACLAWRRHACLTGQSRSEKADRFSASNTRPHPSPSLSQNKTLLRCRPSLPGCAAFISSVSSVEIQSQILRLLPETSGREPVASALVQSSSSTKCGVGQSRPSPQPCPLAPGRRAMSSATRATDSPVGRFGGHRIYKALTFPTPLSL